MEGLPADINSAGNCLYKSMKFRLSMRIPPGISHTFVVDTLREKLTAAGPETFGAKIEFDLLDSGDGFDAPDLPATLKNQLNEATAEVFDGKKPLYVGCGGSIPFMDVFYEIFP